MRIVAGIRMINAIMINTVNCLDNRPVLLLFKEQFIYFFHFVDFFYLGGGQVPVEGIFLSQQTAE